MDFFRGWCLRYRNFLHDPLRIASDFSKYIQTSTLSENRFTNLLQEFQLPISPISFVILRPFLYNAIDFFVELSNSLVHSGLTFPLGLLF